MADRPPTNGDPDELGRLRERVSKVEWRTESIDERLGQGAESFSDLRNSIVEVRADIKEAHAKFQEAIAPKPIPIWKVASFLFGVVCVGAGIIWTFARYPDRAEFEKARDSQADQVKAVDKELDQVKEKQVEIRTDQKLIKGSVDRQEKAQESMDRKLDHLIEQAADQPGGRRR